MDPAAAGITPLLLDPLPFYQSLLYHTIQLRFAIDGRCLSIEIKIAVPIFVFYCAPVCLIERARHGVK